MKIAAFYGKKLPAFSSAAEARERLFAVRDERLTKMNALASSPNGFLADFAPPSLKEMEAWYFRLIECDGFDVLGTSREEIEQCMASYFCEVAVRNCAGTEWYVSEYVFEKGRYEIGVKRGLMNLTRDSFQDHYMAGSNRTRTAIYREYQRYFDR